MVNNLSMSISAFIKKSDCLSGIKFKVMKLGQQGKRSIVNTGTYDEKKLEEVVQQDHDKNWTIIIKKE